MQASTLRDAADTVTETVSDLAHTRGRDDSRRHQQGWRRHQQGGRHGAQAGRPDPMGRAGLEVVIVRRWMLAIGAVIAVARRRRVVAEEPPAAATSDAAATETAPERGRTPPEGRRRPLTLRSKLARRGARRRNATKRCSGSASESRIRSREVWRAQSCAHPCVPGAGLEPASPFGQWMFETIDVCQFRHPGRSTVYCARRPVAAADRRDTGSVAGAVYCRADARLHVPRAGVAASGDGAAVARSRELGARR